MDIEKERKTNGWETHQGNPKIYVTSVDEADVVKDKKKDTGGYAGRYKKIRRESFPDSEKNLK